MIQGFGSSVLIIYFIFFAGYFPPAESASDAELANISLRLYLGNTTTDGIFVDELIGNAVNLLDKMDPSKKTLFYIHGYNENLNRESIRLVIGAYLKRKDHNVVAVDWSEIATKNYIAVAASAEGVGKTLGKALDDMARHSLDPEMLHVVGHSLGCQVSGYLGRNVGFKVPRITGLDPAGPGFYLVFESLNSKDARFVDIIHTDYGVYGVADDSGTANFYPNGGTRIQPGCPRLFVPFGDEAFCSHHRSYVFYAESVTNEEAFVSLECDERYKFSANKCKGNKKVLMGFATPVDTKGLYYLETNDKPPYGRGDDGTNPKSKSFWG